MRTRRLSLIGTASLLVVASAVLWGVGANASEPRTVVVPAATSSAHPALVGHSVTTTFDVSLKSRNPSGLATFLRELYSPTSTLYRHFLTPHEFGAEFGARPSSIAHVRHYFDAAGIATVHLNQGRSILELRGTTSAIAQALDASVRAVRLPGDSVANDLLTPGSLPTTLASQVTSITGLSTLVAQPMTSQTSSHSTSHVATPTTCPNAGSSTTNGPNGLYGYTAQQQGQLYGLSSEWASGTTGVGQTIALYELGRYSPSDVSTYFSCYGVNPSLNAINVDGGSTGSISDEATLDIEEAGVLAPGANLEVYQGPNSNSGPIDVYSQIADDNTASIVSTSWGTCELDPQGSATAEQSIFEQMAAQGQTVLAAAGDSGSADCNGGSSNQTQLAVDDPASQPFVTGVGGLNVSTISPLSESVWLHQSSGNSCDSSGASGGGASAIWSRPTWQQGSGITASQTMRMVPDLSVMGDPATGFIQYFPNGGSCATPAWYTVGGTSIGAPLMSSVVAVAAQACRVTRLGFLNPTLYSMPASDLVDVTSGSNDLTSSGGYSAAVGYDMASGLGSPNGTTFIQGLCPSSIDVANSTFHVAPAAPAAQSTGATLSAHLVTHNQSPLSNAVLNVTATSSNGTLTIDADPSSQLGSGSASYQVSSDANGDVTFSLADSAPGAAQLSVTYQGTTVYSTTLNFVAPVVSPSLIAPRINALTSLFGGVRVALSPPAQVSTLTVRYQYSINGGRTWRYVPAGLRDFTITHLIRRHRYLLRLRSVANSSHSRPSPPRTFVTR